MKTPVALLLLLFAGLASGQTFYAAGLSLLPQSSPKPSGFAAAVIPVSTTQKVYSISEIDFTATRTASGVYSVQTSARTGAAVFMRAFGKLNLYGLGDAGAATTGTNSGGALAGGGIATWPTRWKGVYGAAGVRVLKTSIGGTQTLVEIGIMWGGAK